MPKEPAPRKSPAKSRSENLVDPPPKKSAASKKSSPVESVSENQPMPVVVAAPPSGKTGKKSTPKAKKSSSIAEAVSAPATPANQPENKADSVSSAVRELARSEEAPVVTTIEVRYDAGFGNTLYLRGEGGGLSWEKGVALANVGPDQWTYTLEGATEGLQVKVLLNDTLWCAGANVEVPRGQKTVITPVF